MGNGKCNVTETGSASEKDIEPEPSRQGFKLMIDEKPARTRTRVSVGMKNVGGGILTSKSINQRDN